MYQRILTVCTGNICRSPVAEALLRLQLAADGRAGQVRSAGVRALVGEPVDETALFIARATPALLRELDVHRAQQLDTHLTWWADLILVMDPRHVQQVLKLDPSAKPKLQLLDRAGGAIRDPYMKHESVYREVHDRIATAVSSWRDSIGA